MIPFFGEEDFDDIMLERGSGMTDTKIRMAKEDDYLLKIMLDKMLHHIDKKHITLK